MLEQIAYEMPRVSESEGRQRVYVVGDLESLSSVALYSKEGDTVFRNGRIETIFPKIDDNGTAKIYINPSNFSGIAGFQMDGESHEDYARRMKDGGGISLGGGFSGLSSGGGY